MLKSIIDSSFFFSKFSFNQRFIFSIFSPNGDFISTFSSKRDAGRYIKENIRNFEMIPLLNISSKCFNIGIPDIGTDELFIMIQKYIYSY